MLIEQASQHVAGEIGLYSHESDQFGIGRGLHANGRKCLRHADTRLVRAKPVHTEDTTRSKDVQQPFVALQWGMLTFTIP